jgi:hypothetical protein
VVRLVVAGLAARLKFTLEDTDDLKIAVDELSTYLTGASGRDGTLRLVFDIEDDRLTIRGKALLAASETVRTDLSEFSRMILQTVTDSAALELHDGVPTFYATKRRK